MTAGGRVERVYGGLLRLYPSAFRRDYADEMRVVFRLRVDEARAHGRVACARVCAQELVDVSYFVVFMRLCDIFRHAQARMEMMMSTYRPTRDVRIARWLARLFGLAMALFFLHILSLYAPNNPQVTPLLVAFILATVAMLAAWRWERLGGLATIACAALIGFAGLYSTYVYELSRGVTIWWALVLAWLLWTWPFLMVGWLFVKISRVVAAQASSAA